MIKRLFAAFAVFALIFTACETPNGEEKVGKIHIERYPTYDIEVPGCFNASYVIDEVVEGAKVTATTSAEWIHVNDIFEDTCEIAFCVDENPGDARTGKIVVKYAGATADITINQAAAVIE